MKIFWRVLQILLAVFMIYAGIQHFMKPEFYTPFVPSFLPFEISLIYLSGLFEVVFGLLLLIPRYAKLASTGILLLMLVFLPIHIWDVFADTPAIGSHKAALIRLPIQFVFIGWAFKVRQFLNK
ncbi:MauE/DoxX family redox-associated membrane protein [Maribacter sp. HTCC2170]|uniref:DoxX family protein n=1 Tax=Maribacter sp. (strain HTCC2170 / KCCM 42371) TaxID=313603 RepID=UPI00006BD520|nr:MauE/DoxX family redox-associated membrane protein [Maribacter sp. HTCC2170]EAR02022.1 hypothetical protein FB2170_02025 [Maribacter sp. HTCC2170]